MPRRSGAAQWKGDLQSGGGELSLSSGAFESTYSYASRFKDEGGPGTNPEELLAAAHAACFSMALANSLSAAGHVPESVRTTATVHLDLVEGAPAITRIELDCEAKVPGIGEEEFSRQAEQTKVGCPVSKALSAVPISLAARLA